MIKPIGSLTVDVVPQAIIAMPVEKIIGQSADIRREYDDFDYFEGAFFKLDNVIEIAVRHYRGHPENTATIYIDRKEQDVGRITKLIQRILEDLHVPPSALTWERRNNPEL
jgi:hypothetical protein